MGKWLFRHIGDLAGLVLGLGLLSALVFQLWRWGLFDKSIVDSDKLMPAVLGLLGVLVTAIATLIGVWIKRSIDQRTLQFKFFSEERRKAEAKEAEERLRIEAALRAVTLMSTPSGNDAPKSQKMAALVALLDLCNLGTPCRYKPAG